MHTSHTALLLVALCFVLVSTFSPPVSKNFFLQQYQKRWHRPPQDLLQAGYRRKPIKSPPAMRVMTGYPGSYDSSFQLKQTMGKWYVAPPGGHQRQAADWVAVEKVPIGPPGSDAAAMNSQLNYGPPGVREDYFAGPPGRR